MVHQYYFTISMRLFGLYFQDTLSSVCLQLAIKVVFSAPLGILPCLNPFHWFSVLIRAENVGKISRFCLGLLITGSPNVSHTVTFSLIIKIHLNTCHIKAALNCGTLGEVRSKATCLISNTTC